MCAVKKIAVPSTRCGGWANKLVINSCKWIDPATNLSRKSLRPRYQVIKQVKMMRPKNRGYQPPSLILIKLALQNAKSKVKKIVVNDSTKKRFIFHSRYMTTPNKIAVIIIVDVTEMP